MIDAILEELNEAGAYEQEVNGKTEFLSGISYCISVIKKYIESEPKTGHWIKYGELYQCSECKELSCCQGKFCNECGVEMIEP